MAYYKENGDGTVDMESGDGTMVRVAKTPEIAAMLTTYAKAPGDAAGAGLSDVPSPDVPPPAFEGSILPSIPTEPGLGSNFTAALTRAQNANSAATSAPVASAAPSITTSTSPQDASIGAGTVRRPDIGVETRQDGSASAPPAVTSTSSAVLPTMTETIGINGSTQKMIDPAIAQQLKAGWDRQDVLARNKGEVDEKVGQEEALKFTAQSKQKDDAIRIRTQAAAEAKQQFDDYNSKVAGKLAELEKMDVKPKGMFEGGVGQNITAALAIAFGAMGGALTGSNQNVAIQIMDKAIERDIEAQKANIGKKQQEVNILGLKYQAARQAGMDDVSAKLAVKADAFDQIALMAEAKKATLLAPQAKENAEAARLALKEKSLTTMAELTSRTVENKTQTVSKVDTSKLTKIKLEPKEAQDLTALEAGWKTLNEIEAQIDANGGYLNTKIEKGARFFGQGDEGKVKFNSKVDQLSTVMGKEMMGNLTGNEQEKKEQMLPNADDSPSTLRGKISAIRDRMTALHSTILEGYGVNKEGGAVSESGRILMPLRTTQEREKNRNGRLDAQKD